MENKKMNWGTLILGIAIGAVVVGVVWMASKPDQTIGQGIPNLADSNASCIAIAIASEAGGGGGVYDEEFSCLQQYNDFVGYSGEKFNWSKCVSNAIESCGGSNDLSCGQIANEAYLNCKVNSDIIDINPGICNDIRREVFTICQDEQTPPGGGGGGPGYCSSVPCDVPLVEVPCLNVGEISCGSECLPEGSRCTQNTCELINPKNFWCSNRL